MALQREARVFAVHARAVVADTDQCLAAVFQLYPHRLGTGIERVLDQLFHHGCRSLDDFTGGDLIRDVSRQQLDARARDDAHSPRISSPSTHP